MSLIVKSTRRDVSAIKVMIEAERGSCEKNTYDEKTHRLKAKRRVCCPYPYPYGFVLGTKTADGGGVDCYVITTDPLKAGSIVDCDALGLLEQREGAEVDHKVLASLPGQEIEADQALVKRLRDFVHTVFSEFPDANVEVGRLLSREEAVDYICGHSDT